MGSKSIPPGPDPDKDRLEEKELKNLQGPQVREASIAIEAGGKTSEDGEYTCEVCGEPTYFEKDISVPNCSECGGQKFRKERST